MPRPSITSPQRNRVMLSAIGYVSRARIDRIDQLLVGRVVGTGLEHIPFGVVGRVGARILVDGWDLDVELPRW